MTRFFIAIAVFCSAPLLAADVLWLKLTPRFTYKDLITACSTEHFPTTLYFSAEIENGKVLRAGLKSHTMDVFANRIFFLPSELEEIEWHHEVSGRLWLAKLPLSTRLLVWVFQNAGNGFQACKPSRPMKTLSPAQITYVFDVAPEESGLATSSQVGRFAGTLVNGNSFAATLGWSQEQWSYPVRAPFSGQ